MLYYMIATLSKVEDWWIAIPKNMVLLLYLSSTRLLTPPKMSFQFIYILGKTIHGEINANLRPILYCTAIRSYYCLLQAGKMTFS